MEVLRRQAEKLIKARRDHKRWLQAFICLSIILIISLEPILGLNGIALTKQEKVLACSFSGKAAHSHNDDCYDSSGNLVCSLPEKELHEHNDNCYTWNRELTCGLEESEEHTHTEDCYTISRGELICGQEEIVETHVHDASCFRTVEVQVDEPENKTAAAEHETENTANEGTAENDAAQSAPSNPVASNTQTDNSNVSDVTQNPSTNNSTTNPSNESGKNDIAEPENSAVVNDSTGIKPVNNTSADTAAPVIDPAEIKESNPEADLENQQLWDSIFANWQRSGEWNRDLVLASG